MSIEPVVNSLNDALESLRSVDMNTLSSRHQQRVASLQARVTELTKAVGLGASRFPAQNAFLTFNEKMGEALDRIQALDLESLSPDQQTRITALASQAKGLKDEIAGSSQLP